MSAAETTEGRAQIIFDLWRSVQDSPEFTGLHPDAQDLVAKFTDNLDWIMRYNEHSRDKLRALGLLAGEATT